MVRVVWVVLGPFGSFGSGGSEDGNFVVVIVVLVVVVWVVEQGQGVREKGGRESVFIFAAVTRYTAHRGTV